MSGASLAGILYGPDRPEPTSTAAESRPRSSPRSIITRDGEHALRAELARLHHELEVEFAARLRDARAFGGAAGNDEYLQIKEEEAVLTAGIARLEARLASADVVEDAGAGGGVAAIGTVVEVEDLDSGAVDERLLIGGHEQVTTAKAASADSPVGRGLMGRAAGDEVEVGLPGARKLRLRIIAIRPRGRG